MSAWISGRARVMAVLLALSTIGPARECLGAPDAPAPLDRVVAIDLRAQNIPAALIELSRQANVQIIMPARTLDSYQTPAIRGRMTVGTALKRILRSVSHEVRPAQGNTIAIEVPGAAAPVE